MGYYTNFEVEVRSDDPEAAKAAAKALEKQMGGYSVDWTGDTDFELTDAKWYDWLDDVVNVSKLFPSVMFYLEGKGEESGDLWKAWGHAGNVFQSQAELTYVDPPWLAVAQSTAKSLAKDAMYAAAALTEAEERAELARLHEKYGD